MSNQWMGPQPRQVYAGLKKLSAAGDWFEVYEAAENCFVFYEPRHCEETISNLIIGRDKAALIDTGCGIGDLQKAVGQVTNKPVMVINTHTHLDHVGSNHQFDEIAMFDHPLARRLSKEGASHRQLVAELLADKLVVKPWPIGFYPERHSLPPFGVCRWLKDGDRIDLGERELEVIHTPGEAPDHISLLDRAGRLLFCGDSLLHGSIWTHLEGGSLNELRQSYRKLLDFKRDFDYLMPSHNEPLLQQDLLTDSLAAVESVLSGQAGFQLISDPWGKRLKEYSFGKFSILTSL